MIRRLWPVVCVLGLGPAAAAAEPEDQSVYALPAPPTEKTGTNLGGLGLSADVRYMTQHIYRGVNITDLIGDVSGKKTSGGANFQFEGYLSFNLDKLPHPYIGVFTNILDSDEFSNFEEVRPMVGAEWQIRPLVLTLGNNTYIYPERSAAGTSDAFLKILLDDAAIFRREKRLLSPYVTAAYDYDNYKGWYFELGVSHEFPIENTGITLTFLADVAYVADNDMYILPGNPKQNNTGLQHYDVGMIAKYNLNQLLNVSQRFGSWNLTGYIYYTDGIDTDLRSASQLWGGGGLELKY
jgi:hypothetical protein